MATQGQAAVVVDRVERELLEWKRRALAAEETLRHRAGAVLIRGEYLPKVERRHGYAMLLDQLGGAAVIVDQPAVELLCTALGLGLELKR